MPSRTILLTSLLLALAPPVSVHAGTYDVYACRLPDGTPAPTRGWTPIVNFVPTAGESGAFDQCATSRRFGATLLAPQAAPGDKAGWSFDAPTGTAIVGFRLHRRIVVSSAVPSRAAYLSSFGAWPSESPGMLGEEFCDASAASCSQLGVNTPEDDPSNVYELAGLDVRRLALGVWCLPFPGAEPCPAPTGSVAPGVLEIFDARITLLDASPPQFGADLTVTANGARETPVARVVASDQGGGVAGVELSIDGNLVAQSPAGACEAQPYIDPSPCTLNTDVRLPFDTSSLLDGTHELRATAEDAGGNRAVSRPVTLVTRGGVLLAATPSAPEPGALLPNGSGASRFAKRTVRFDERSGRSVKTLAYGVRTRLAGRLTTAEGLSISGAKLAVEERQVAAGSAARPIASVTTGKDGRFVYPLKPGASRVVRFSYRAFPSDPAPVAVGQVTVHVRAGVSLRVTPNRVRNGSVIAFRGHVRGGRALVTIYALAGGPRKRIPVETVRAGSDGRFGYRYRFRSIPGPSVYRFEARVPKQTGFPYSEGASGVVVVRGRP